MYTDQSLKYAEDYDKNYMHFTLWYRAGCFWYYTNVSNGKQEQKKETKQETFLFNLSLFREMKRFTTLSKNVAVL